MNTVNHAITIKDVITAFIGHVVGVWTNPQKMPADVRGDFADDFHACCRDFVVDGLVVALQVRIIRLDAFSFGHCIPFKKVDSDCFYTSRRKWSNDFMDVKAFNDQIIDEFRANNGKVAMFADYPMIILHSIGARSGNPLLVPLVLTTKDNGDRILFASFAGSQKNPAWVYNLRANPEIDIELAEGRFKARAVEYDEAEAKDLVSGQAEISEQFAQYVASAAPRQIPVFRIDILV